MVFFPHRLPHLLNRYVFSCLNRPGLYVRKKEKPPPKLSFFSFLLVDLLFTEPFPGFYFLKKHLESFLLFLPIGNFCQVFIFTLPVTFL